MVFRAVVFKLLVWCGAEGYVLRFAGCCSILAMKFLHNNPPMKTEQSVPKRRNINFRRRGITQKKTYKNSAISLVLIWRWTRNRDKYAAACHIFLCMRQINKQTNASYVSWIPLDGNVQQLHWDVESLQLTQDNRTRWQRAVSHCMQNVQGPDLSAAALRAYVPLVPWSHARPTSVTRSDVRLM